MVLKKREFTPESGNVDTGYVLGKFSILTRLPHHIDSVRDE